jgi:hypothetical protein
LFLKENLADFLFSSIFMASLASPGGFAAYFGFRLIKEKNKQNIKVSVGTLAVFAVFFLYVLVGWRVLSNHTGAPFSLLIMTVAAVLIYIPVSRFLMIREGLTPNPKGEFVGKGIILIIAWQIWFAGVQAQPLGSKVIFYHRRQHIGHFCSHYNCLYFLQSFHEIHRR